MNFIDVLKLLAVVSMAADHVNTVLLSGSSQAMFLAGRFAFPAFAVLCGYAAVRARDPWSYMVRLAVWAVVAILPFLLAFPDHPATLDVLFTLLAGVALIRAVSFGEVSWFLAVLLLSPWSDFSVQGVMLVVLAGLWFRCGSMVDSLLWSVAFVLCAWFIAQSAVAFVVVVLSFLLSVLLVCLSSGRGVGWRRLWYAFYPGHLSVLWALGRAFGVA